MSATTNPRSSRLPVASAAVSRRRGAGRIVRLRLGGVHLRLIALWRSGELDRQLAAGVDPQSSSALTVHAERITRSRSRSRLAHGLSRALRSARDTAPGFTAAVRPYASELIAADSVLASLDRNLRGPEPVNAQSVAILRALLTDAASPLYQPGEPGALVSRLRTAAAILGSRELQDHPGSDLRRTPPVDGLMRSPQLGSQLAPTVHK